jgi:hypothetical protein
MLLFLDRRRESQQEMNCIDSSPIGIRVHDPGKVVWSGIAFLDSNNGG